LFAYALFIGTACNLVFAFWEIHISGLSNNGIYSLKEENMLRPYYPSASLSSK